MNKSYGENVALTLSCPSIKNIENNFSNFRSDGFEMIYELFKENKSGITQEKP